MRQQQEEPVLGVQAGCGDEVDVGLLEPLLEGFDEGQHLFYRLGLAVGPR